MDPHAGLGRFRNFIVSNYQLMVDLIGYCRKYTIEEILQLANIKEWGDIYFQYEAAAKEQFQYCAIVHSNLVMLDLIDEENIWPTNRFSLYALFPQTNISIHTISGKKVLNPV
mgnify:CR=1 FL=1